MVSSGASHAVMEVSSHALHQDRVDGLSFQVAVFTNLSRDHLYYHRDLESYFAAKARLFRKYLSPQGRAVVNVSDAWGLKLAEELGAQAIRVGEGASLSGKVEARLAEGYRFSLEHQGKRYSLATRLYGDFQLENLLLSVGVGLALGLSFEEAVEALSGVCAPPGRLELVACPQGALVFVDYAHTPEALAKALMSLRPLVSGRLFCVFGCGGERDRGKRPLMGEVASRLADRVIVTSDNPRAEDPERIVADILTGISGKAPRVILDRREAIFEALRALAGGDVLLIAGKGHEDYQEIQGVRYPFSDREVVREFVMTEAA
jgi:UDP-N-acetylmuramoyl-L-alanyl-D-glutamate--2,6-diaminopimelate ligase